MDNNSASPPPKAFPRTFYYLLALAILLSGWGAAAKLGWNMIEGGSGLLLMNAPGSKMFRLAAGDYTLYHEYEGIADDKIYYQPLAPERLTISLKTPGDDGKPVELHWIEPKAVYAFGSRHGAEIAAFRIGAPGQFVLDAASHPGESAPPTLLSIGDGRERIAMRRFQIVLGITLASTVFAAALWLWATLRFWRRT